MKFSAAALCFLATAPVSTAFVPRAFGNRRISAIYQSSDVDLQKLVSEATLVNGASVESAGKASAKIELDPRAEEEAAKLAAISARAGAAAYMAQYEGQSGAALVYSKLEEHGVKVVNGFSGGAVLPLLDQFHEEHPRHGGKKPIQWITNSNEASAGHIAEGYAKAMPVDPDQLPVGVAIATSGPGVTNLITPLQDAICDGVPMVVLCGQAATVAPEDAFQSSPAVDLTRPCTKWSYQIKSAAEIPLVMDYAFFIARNGRPGPVFVDLPKDLQNQILTSDLINQFVDAENPGDEDSFARLEKSRRPDGEIFQALRLGSEGRYLPFEIVKDPSNMYKVKPVKEMDMVNKYHMDHHTTNKIFRSPRPNHKEEVSPERIPRRQTADARASRGQAGLRVHPS